MSLASLLVRVESCSLNPLFGVHVASISCLASSWSSSSPVAQMESMSSLARYCAAHVVNVTPPP